MLSYIGVEAVTIVVISIIMVLFANGPLNLVKTSLDESLTQSFNWFVQQHCCLLFGDAIIAHTLATFGTIYVAGVKINK